MLVKVIILFLLAMVLLGMIGKLLFPGKIGRLTRLRRAGLKAAKAPRCAKCGRYIIGRAGCDCGKA